jgi:hypothetical protein
MKSNGAKLQRAKEMIMQLSEIYQPKCAHCGEPMDWKVFYPNLSGMQNDNWVMHHINHKHNDNRSENKCLMHKDCHKKHHYNIDKIDGKNPLGHL